MDKILISFSGGETSAYMAKTIMDGYKGKSEIVCVFANTGQEREETLIFADRCDKEFGLNLVWLEAVIDPADGQGTRHRVVDFKTANRNGDVFEAVIQKYGIPNTSYPHCTRELKLQPIGSYLKSIGWKDHYTAIGIRADEIDRVNENHKALRYWYPLADARITKAHVKDFWAKQDFGLGLKEHQGNCAWCWKKSDRKIFTLVEESPEIFEFPKRMEALYSKVKAPDDDRTFWRKKRTTEQMLEEAKKPFTKFIESKTYVQNELDFGSGCEESCEAYSGVITA
jgi:3'-phosphoadenosine 5'-phosphosulfate sulfotransferase (PAPS reductase)/FAD synthetase